MSKEELLKLLDMVDERIRRVEEELKSLRKLRELIQAKILEIGGIRPEERELATILESVRWRRYPSGTGEWCFADQLPESFIKELKRSPNKSKEVSGHIYRLKVLSGGKEIVSRRESHEHGKMPREEV